MSKKPRIALTGMPSGETSVSGIPKYARYQSDALSSSKSVMQQLPHRKQFHDLFSSVRYRLFEQDAVMRYRFGVVNQ